MGRIQNYKNWSPEMVPDPSRTALGLEYFVWDQDTEWRWPEARLVALGIEECARIGLIRSADVEDGTVVRMPKAYPVYDHEYQTHVAVLRQYLATLTNLQTIGRNGLHRYNNQDHSMLTGIYAARNLIGEQHDVWAVNTEMEYHEEVRTSTPSRGDRLVPTAIETAVREATTPEERIAVAFAKVDPLAFGVAVGVVSGLVLFLMTVTLLLKGGAVVGPTLALLGHYLPGFSVSWSGARIGLLEVTLGGFVLGYVGAWLRNWGMRAYAALVRNRANAEEQRHVLEKI
jgi:hypothetical protein